jgi:hypothetical protein
LENVKLRKTIKVKTDETVTIGPLSSQATVNNSSANATVSVVPSSLLSNSSSQPNAAINKLGNRFSMFEQNNLMSASSSSFSNAKPVLPKKPEQAGGATSPTTSAATGTAGTLAGDNQRLSEEASEEAETGNSVQEPHLIKPSSIITKPLPPLPPNKPPRPLFAPTSSSGK